jgi:hypothetical protein
MLSVFDGFEQVEKLVAATAAVGIQHCFRMGGEIK